MDREDGWRVAGRSRTSTPSAFGVAADHDEDAGLGHGSFGGDGGRKRRRNDGMKRPVTVDRCPGRPLRPHRMDGLSLVHRHAS